MPKKIDKTLANAIRLGVNIDHAATLRQVRGGQTDYPDLIQLAKLAKSAGAHQITVHLREDRRHIQDKDVHRLCKDRVLPLNLEMACTGEMFQTALRRKPDWICLVPEKRRELTTEGGLDIQRNFAICARYFPKIRKAGIRVSFFIAADPKQVVLASQLGADAVEFHTGHWVLEKGRGKKSQWKQLVEAARFAHQLGMGVHAGHGLDYAHCQLIRNLPYLAEVNVGHSLICYSLTEGLGVSISKMLTCLNPSLAPKFTASKI